MTQWYLPVRLDICALFRHSVLGFRQDAVETCRGVGNFVFEEQWTMNGQFCRHRMSQVHYPPPPSGDHGVAIFSHKYLHPIPPPSKLMSLELLPGDPTLFFMGILLVLHSL